MGREGTEKRREEGKAKGRRRERKGRGREGRKRARQSVPNH